jgi:hypothetical protein
VRRLYLRLAHGRGSGRHRGVAADELPQHLVHKPFLELHRLGGDGVPVPDWALDRLASRALAQPVEAEVVVEQLGDPALEAVEAGQGVVAQSEQKANRHVAVRDEAGQLGAEPVAGVGRVGGEILLELVHHDQELDVQRAAQSAKRVV